ncbi:hypothetical protein SERLA73DRAFT_70169 [Serpula lacrymans var. lacrymans S7.3]|uniref:Integrase catalytic domain-containing protein n=1 Tax=Serpula lacrymans var. lacrymans (strain S7.3) TaxID=936435 RepID=F8PM50_SERL3|nr:hypothetical protein SERLA73DRAFT_70169 [Serpula lacrymans var. lacrymans S7.3]
MISHTSIHCTQSPHYTSTCLPPCSKSSVNAIDIGTVILQATVGKKDYNIALSNVLLVPNFTLAPVSVHKLSEVGLSTLFPAGSNTCEVQKKKELFLTASHKRGLYHIQAKPKINPESAFVAVDVNALHRRMGQIGMDCLQWMVTKGQLQEIDTFTGTPEFSADTPEQNGIAERMNQTLATLATTMHHDSKLPSIRTPYHHEDVPRAVGQYLRGDVPRAVGAPDQLRHPPQQSLQPRPEHCPYSERKPKVESQSVGGQLLNIQPADVEKVRIRLDSLSIGSASGRHTTPFKEIFNTFRIPKRAVMPAEVPGVSKSSRQTCPADKNRDYQRTLDEEQS